MLAPGRPGTSDRSAAAAAEVAGFFGTARATDFTIGAQGPEYHGAADWGLRRFVLHQAHLCAMAGGVEAFCRGSELRGLATIRGQSDGYPAVAALRALAGEVRAVLGPGVKLSYAVDWSEYHGHQPGGSTKRFHPTLSGPTRRSISSASTTTCRCRIGATARITSTRRSIARSTISTTSRVMLRG